MSIAEPVTVETVVAGLRARANPRNVDGMRRYGIRAPAMLGISITELRGIAKPLRPDHALAAALWATGIHEARHLAAMVDDPAAVTKTQMNAWAKDWASWDLCDGCCTGLFDRTPHAPDIIARWAVRRGEFEKRGAFALMAGLAVHDKQAPDALFRGFFPIIEAAADDDRVYVKKGVNWALRQIGKRNRRLHGEALRCATRIGARSSRAARWIATDALRELRSDAVVARVAHRR